MKVNIKRIVRICIHLIYLCISYVLASMLKIISNKYRHIWIVSERGDDARDNGYFFYQYLKKNRPEIQSYFIISRKSADYPRIAQLGNAIEYNSFLHYLYYALCEVRISSSAWGGDLPKADYFYKMRKILPHNKKSVFLQHGITKDYLPLLLAENNPVDLFVCGAEPEYQYIRDNFHYASGVVQYTGLCRFDNLHNVQTKRQILIMPTFRRWLQGNQSISDSEFFRIWNSILKDKRIDEVLQAENLQLIFYPHYVIQKYIDEFSVVSDRMVIASFEDFDVQKLLKESILLITDFSSVFFDFGYMNKPIIYFQFDREKYIREHYDFTQGYFDYDSMGFGPVVFSADTLVEQIKMIVKQNFQVQEMYAERINRFFPLKDRNNGERIFQSINQLLN